MPETTPEAKRTYPYMSIATWYAIRAKLRAKVPRRVDADWLMSAIGTSRKGAANLVPQLRTMGIMSAEGAPTDIVADIRDDSSYAGAAQRIVEGLYPASLHDGFPDPGSNLEGVRHWFMRNAGTGEATALAQARFYTALTKGDLPSDDDVAKPIQRRSRTKQADLNGGASKGVPADGAGATSPADVIVDRQPDGARNDSDSARNGQGGPLEQYTARRPNLVVDLQIHIAADAGQEQIDAIFASMAKHLYGRE